VTINYCSLKRGEVKRIIASENTKHIITMDINGNICIIDGINLIQKQTIRCPGAFFTDMTLSNDDQFLFISYKTSIMIQKINLNTVCQFGKSPFRGLSLFWISAILIVFLAIFLSFIQRSN